MKTDETYHEILAKSYLVYFICSSIALFFDSRLNLHFSFPLQLPIAIICFGAGPLLILWAQFSSSGVATTQQRSGLYFGKGPYKYMRNPTQLGLLILVAGYTLISSSIIFFAVTIVSYFISNIYFKRYEKYLAIHFTEHYNAYKEKVKKLL